jgi:outer membrane protein OmpA-like peptidoglycan-associated protein
MRAWLAGALVALGAAGVAAVVLPASPAAAVAPSPGADGWVRGELQSDPADAQGVTAQVTTVNGEVRDILITVETADGTFGVTTGGPTTTVTVQADVLFPSGKYSLTPAANAKIEAVSGELHTRRASGSITVGGHADSVGNPQDNQVLSERRARTVSSALKPLVRDLNVALLAQGFGETRPVRPNKKPDGSDNPEGRARNRRVTVTFVPGTGVA